MIQVYGVNPGKGLVSVQGIYSILHRYTMYTNPVSLVLCQYRTPWMPFRWMEFKNQLPSSPVGSRRAGVGSVNAFFSCIWKHQDEPYKTKTPCFICFWCKAQPTWIQKKWVVSLFVVDNPQTRCCVPVFRCTAVMVRSLKPPLWFSWKLHCWPQPL